MITVFQLILELRKMSKDAIAILSCDGEGNHFSTVSEIEEHTFSKGRMGFCELDPPRARRKAVVLYPGGSEQDPMTVGQLIQKIAGVGQAGVYVIIAKDEEGNSYSGLHGLETNIAYKNGEVGLPKLTAKDRADGFDDSYVCKGGKPAVAMYPMV